MSTAVDTTTNDIPDYPEYAGRTFKTYRIANGKICIGRSQDGNLEEFDSKSGVLLRVGFHEGVDEKTGEPFKKAECEIREKGSDTITISASLSSTTSSCQLMQGLLGVRAGDIIAIRPVQATTETKFGNRVTFVNVAKFNTASNAWQEVKGKPYPGERIADRLPLVIDDFANHPDYKERAKKVENDQDVSPWDNFDIAMKAQGWPSIFGKADGAYFALFAKVLGTPVNDMAGVPADKWQSLKESCQQQHKKAGLPASLKPFVVDMADFDPFAEE